MKFNNWKMNLIAGLCLLFIALTRLLVKDFIGMGVFILISLLFFLSMLSTNKGKNNNTKIAIPKTINLKILY